MASKLFAVCRRIERWRARVWRREVGGVHLDFVSWEE